MFHRIASNLAVVSTALVAIGGLVANSTPVKSDRCSIPESSRQEWRDMTRNDQSDFIKAVKCLQKAPPTGSITAAKSLFDDFQGVHIDLATQIHLVGQFLPWHRRFLYVFEVALREKCHYSGALPYWDWSRDIDADGTIAKSPVFDATHGFGGNGINIPGYAGPFGNLSNIPGWVPGTGGGCVPDGPFASYNLSLGPGTVPTNHCLTRAFNNQFPSALSSAQVANTTKQTNFENFRIELEGRPITPLPKLHDQGHYQTGGEMFDFYSSPGDPLFYLHHANLDRIWWDWQKADLGERLYQISGRTTTSPPYVNVTLDFPLSMLQLAPQVTIRDVMDIECLCYTYI